MLEILDKPVVIKVEGKSPRKQVYLFGKSDAVSLVAQQRANDGHCRQSNVCPEPHRLRVIYEMEGEEVKILSVHLKVGESWKSYFQNDEEALRRGKMDAPVGHQMLYYLTQEQVEPVEKLLAAYENRRALRRLARKGPDVFPKRRSGD